ncbi:BTB/POZ protein [Glomus cerebriforme]|uniref:BTB/POZ protein n=1 Tax=Glomus cerebriforme TaxID=658196 RepID=A0A397SCD3_9GLOM|nr:BTB/POZ protein [Glomus cerebriforme]
MSSIFHSNLSRDLSLILNDADDFDVIIQVGGHETIKEFRAHSVILRARSTYFKNVLSTEWITKKNDMIIFNKPNITPSVFDLILKYIYTGELNLTKQSSEDIFRLLIASDELLLDELFDYVQNYLIEKQTSWIHKNFLHVLYTVFKLTKCKKLQDYCLESICKNPEPFITSENFPSLDKDILYGLLERDDFSVEEVAIWDCLIKWGIEQTPGLGSGNSDKTKWNYKNYEALKKTLDQFIPLIRFLEISSENLFDKVRPYKAIIPHYIYEEIEEFYYKKTLPKTIILSSRTGKLASTIIKPRLATIISN